MGSSEKLKTDVVHDELVSTIKEKMDTVFPHCICKVDEKFVRENKKAYHPEVISIGPFHHGRPELQKMEVHKWRYLHALLNRKPDMEATLAKCVTEIRGCELKARNCYLERETIKLNSDEFVTMMLVDGCFIIELFLKRSFKALRKRGDPIFTKHETIGNLRFDMVLLENQYPLFVLHRLFGIVPIPEICSCSLNSIAFNFFKNIIPGNKKTIQVRFDQEGNHLLDLIHNCFLPTFSDIHPFKETQQNKQSQQQLQDQASAIEKLKTSSKLHESGITLRKTDNKGVLDFDFKNGVLYIPEVKIHRYTEALLRNLIAGEQCNRDDFEHVTSYVCLLAKLICTNKDEKILTQKNILSSSLKKEDGDVHEEVHELFKKLADEVVMTNFYFEELCKQVVGYKKESWFSLPSCFKK